MWRINAGIEIKVQIRWTDTLANYFFTIPRGMSFTVKYDNDA